MHIYAVLYISGLVETLFQGAKSHQINWSNRSFASKDMYCTLYLTRRESCKRRQSVRASA
jgi:hypothetical protein